MTITLGKHALHIEWSGILFALLLLILFYIVMAFIAIMIATILQTRKSKRLNRYGEIVGRFHDWWISLLTDKLLGNITTIIIFIFARKYYLKSQAKVFKEKFGDEIKKAKQVAEDERTKAHALSRDRDDWKNAYYKVQDQSAYWDGAKFGYKLREKQAKKGTVPDTEIVGDLDDSERFALKQIAKNNGSIGFASARLEERKLVMRVYDNREHNKFHYELTADGQKELERIRK